MNKIKIEENKNIYEDDIINNYKRYYINYLNLMKENISLENIDLIDLTSSQINTSISSINNNNYILCEYDIKKENELIRILNCFEEAKKEKSWFEGINYENEIKNNCELYLNNNKINFSLKYKTPKTQEKIKLK